MKTTVCSTCTITLAAILSAVSSEKCGYVRGPLAATNDTVVIKLDCNQSTPPSQYVPLQLCDNATHVAIKLVYCHTVPVGLFTNVTDNLTSVTVASQDATHLLDGTFRGLGYVTELRLLGFTRLINLSRSLLEPLRRIQTLILDGFGSDNIELPYIGSVIRKLSGTPIRRLVINGIRGGSLFEQIVHVDNFKISNASVKELIFSGDVPFNYQGSIRRAFRELTCFCATGLLDRQGPKTFPALLDLFLISDHLKEIVLYRTKNANEFKPSNNYSTVGLLEEYVKFIVTNGAELYPDLVNYIHNRSLSEDCALGFVFKIGANLSKITVRDMSLAYLKTEKPICVEENNNLVYANITGSLVPGTLPEFIGAKKLQYLILENTNIRKLPNAFLQHFPALKLLKLSKVDIGDFLKNTAEDFFGSCPTLSSIHLDNCNIKNIPKTIFSRSINLQRLNLSNNYLRSIDFDLQNCMALNMMDFSHNSIESISQKLVDHLNQLAVKGSNLVVDLSNNRLHCLCNSTHFIKWLQPPLSGSNVKFPGFDSYTCLHPNGSTVRVSAVIVSELEQRCSVIQTLINGSDCPCDEQERTRLERVWESLDGFFCRNDAGDLVAMKTQHLPSCFNPYTRASFIAPVVIGGILGITVLIIVGLLIYFRNSRRVKQVRECLNMNPGNFIRIALQYVMTQNRAEEQALFQYDMIVFAQDDDRSNIHTRFVEALQGTRNFITRDDFLPGVAEVDAMVESIRVCQWIVPVLTANFLSDPVCVDFISRVQFSRPHALIPIVWEHPLDVTDVSVQHLLRTGEPLYWPCDLASPEDKRNFWSTLIERTIPL